MLIELEVSHPRLPDGVRPTPPRLSGPNPLFGRRSQPFSGPGRPLVAASRHGGFAFVDFCEQPQKLLGHCKRSGRPRPTDLAYRPGHGKVYCTTTAGHNPM